MGGGLGGSGGGVLDVPVLTGEVFAGDFFLVPDVTFGVLLLNLEVVFLDLGSVLEEDLFPGEVLTFFLNWCGLIILALGYFWRK